MFQDHHSIHSLQSDARDLASSGLDALRDGRRQVSASARHASERAVDHIRSDPFKSMLVAAAAGAVLVAVVGYFSRSQIPR